jgi:hypothetical protein
MSRLGFSCPLRGRACKKDSTAKSTGCGCRCLCSKAMKTTDTREGSIPPAPANPPGFRPASPRNARTGPKRWLFTRSISPPGFQFGNPRALIPESLRPRPPIFQFCGDLVRLRLPREAGSASHYRSSDRFASKAASLLGTIESPEVCFGSGVTHCVVQGLGFATTVSAPSQRRLSRRKHTSPNSSVLRQETMREARHSLWGRDTKAQYRGVQCCMDFPLLLHHKDCHL